MLLQAAGVTMLSFVLGGFAQIEPREISNGILPNKRQAGTGVSSSTTPTTTPPTTTPPTTTPSSTTEVIVSSTTIPTTVSVTTTNADGSSVTTTIATSTVSVTSTTETKKASLVTVGSSTINAATLSSTTVVSEPLVTKHTVEATYTSFFTAGGSVQSSLFSTQYVTASTTGYAKTTIAPALADGGGSGSNLSTNTKSVIGGVVGGIGGAVVVGALAFVLWRVWGKKRHDAHDDYAESYSKSNRESSMTFGSEGYGQGGRRVNTASNF